MYSAADLATIVTPPDNPAGKCQKAVDEASLALGRAGIDHEVVEGRFAAWKLDNGVDETYHWYIRIDATTIAGDDNLIVDPTVHQFTEPQYHEHDVGAYVPADCLPDTTVIPETHSLFRVYE